MKNEFTNKDLKEEEAERQIYTYDINNEKKMNKIRLINTITNKH